MPKGDIDVTEALSILRRLRIAPKSARSGIINELIACADRVANEPSPAAAQLSEPARAEITDALVGVRAALAMEKDPVKVHSLVCSARKLNARLQ